MGYFRIFYYITYILNFILRLIKRHGKAVLWFICIAVFLVICMYNPKSNAAYLGDDTYYDPYYAIYQKYDSICVDFIRRFDVYRNQLGVADSVQSIVDKFKTIDYYIYYQEGVTDDFGVSSLNGGIFNDNVIRVVFYETSNFNLSVEPSALYTNYFGAEDNIRQITYTRNVANYKAMLRLRQGAWDLTFENTGLNTSFYIPQSLFHYNNKYIYEYFVNNTSLKEIELMYEMRNKLNSVDETLQQQQEYLEQEPISEDFSTDDLPTDSGVTATTDSGLNSFFTQIYNGFIAEPNYAQHTIKVPIPFTRKTI